MYIFDTIGSEINQKEMCPQCGNKLEQDELLLDSTTSPNEDDVCEECLVCGECDYFKILS